MTLNVFKRWLYRGQRPNWIAKVLNKALPKRMRRPSAASEAMRFSYHFR